MRQAVMDSLLQDRAHAGRLLSKKLSIYKGSAVVVGIPQGGACVAAEIAKALSLPLEILPCRKIKHPADGKCAIGAMTADETLIRNFSQSIPQDYVFHQIAMIRNALQNEQRLYYTNWQLPSFQYKTIVLVDDVLDSSDAMLACIRSIKKQKPLKIIVAVPLVAAEAARLVQAEADDLVFLQIEPVINSPGEYYEKFPLIDQAKVKEILESARKKLALYE